jgi:putative ABC transport system substrate-binding protein
MVGAAAVAWPLTARAQQPTMPVIGFLSSRTAADTKNERAAFHEGLAAEGHVERQNIAIEYRWADLQYNRLPELAAELANRHVAVIAATGGGVSVLAARRRRQQFQLFSLRAIWIRSSLGWPTV